MRYLPQMSHGPRPNGCGAPGSLNSPIGFLKEKRSGAKPKPLNCLRPKDLGRLPKLISPSQAVQIELTAIKTGIYGFTTIRQDPLQRPSKKRTLRSNFGLRL